MERDFDYAKSGPTKVPVNQNVTAVLERWDNRGLAVLRFTDQADQPVDRPSSVCLKEHDPDRKRPPFTKPPVDSQQYVISSCGRYSLYDGKNLVFRLIPKQVQTIITNAD